MAIDSDELQRRAIDNNTDAINNLVDTLEGDSAVRKGTSKLKNILGSEKSSNLNKELTHTLKNLITALEKNSKKSAVINVKEMKIDSRQLGAAMGKEMGKSFKLLTITIKGIEKTIEKVFGDKRGIPVYAKTPLATKADQTLNPVRAMLNFFTAKPMRVYVVNYREVSTGREDAVKGIGGFLTKHVFGDSQFGMMLKDVQLGRGTIGTKQKGSEKLNAFESMASGLGGIFGKISGKKDEGPQVSTKSDTAGILRSILGEVRKIRVGSEGQFKYTKKKDDVDRVEKLKDRLSAGRDKFKTVAKSTFKKSESFFSDMFANVLKALPALLPALLSLLLLPAGIMAFFVGLFTEGPLRYIMKYISKFIGENFLKKFVQPLFGLISKIFDNLIPLLGKAMDFVVKQIGIFAAKHLKEVFGGMLGKVLTKGAKSGAAIFKTILKGLGKFFAKNILKRIPVIGTIIGIAFALPRLWKGDIFGFILDMASALAGLLDLLIPGLGTAISVAIDIFSMIRDSKKTDKDRAAEKKNAAGIQNFFKNATKTIGKLFMKFGRYLPLVGPVFWFMDAFASFKKGDIFGGITNILKGIFTFFGGGPLILAGEALISMFDKKNHGKATKAINKVGGAVGGFFGNIGKTLFDFFAKNGKNIPIIGGFFWISDVVEAFKKGDVVGGLTGIVKAIAAFMGGGPLVAAVDFIFGLFQKVGDNNKKDAAMGKQKNILESFIETMVQGIVDILKTVWKFITDTMNPSKIIGQIQSAVTGFMNSSDDKQDANKAGSIKADGTQATAATMTQPASQSATPIAPKKVVMASDKSKELLSKMADGTQNTNSLLMSIGQILVDTQDLMAKFLVAQTGNKNIVAGGGDSSSGTLATTGAIRR